MKNRIAVSLLAASLMAVPAFAAQPSPLPSPAAPKVAASPKPTATPAKHAKKASHTRVASVKTRHTHAAHTTSGTTEPATTK